MTRQEAINRVRATTNFTFKADHVLISDVRILAAVAAIRAQGGAQAGQPPAALAHGATASHPAQ
jgi:hypothetical protein